VAITYAPTDLIDPEEAPAGEPVIRTAPLFIELEQLTVLRRDANRVRLRPSGHYLQAFSGRAAPRWDISRPLVILRFEKYPDAPAILDMFGSTHVVHGIDSQWCDHGARKFVTGGGRRCGSSRSRQDITYSTRCFGRP